MRNDLIGDARAFILRHFPERQIYIRTSSGELDFKVLTTKQQLILVGGLSMMAIWCLFTMFNLLIGNNPLQSSKQEFRQLKAEYERILADSKAKEDNAKLLLAEQRSNFESMARQLEEKHQTLSQIMGSTTALTFNSNGTIKFAPSDVLMAPISRDIAPRSSRRAAIEKNIVATGLQFDSSLNRLGENQDEYLLTAERETLDKIEQNRALIQATDLSVDSVLGESSFGKGGAYFPIDSQELSKTGFMDRVSAIQARVAEVDALNQAVKSLPMGHPVADETYRTSSFGMRSDPFTKRPSFHHGLDFGGQNMTPVVATAGGVVTYVGYKGAYGRIVEIDHGHGFKTRYAHLHKTFVKRGQNVEKGFKIAGMGNTGRSTATHLHYEVHFQGRSYDPDKFLKAGLYVQ